MVSHTTLKMHMHMACVSWSRDTHCINQASFRSRNSCHLFLIGRHQTSFGHINTVAVSSQYKPQINKLIYHYEIGLTSGRFFTMDATEYWLFSQEFSIWNASVAALQLWTDDLDPQMLSTTIERVYTTFFYSDSAQHLWQKKKYYLVA